MLRLSMKTLLSHHLCWLTAAAAVLLPIAVNSLPAGFVRELVVNKSAVSGSWASNPRNNGKPMLILASDSGVVRVLENPDESDKVVTILELKFEDQEICTNGERGLQTAIAHPDFENNLWVYVYYTGFREDCLEGFDVSPSNVVDRFRMDPETLLLDKETREEIWRNGPSARQNHNGGALAFGNDGKLYVTTGDGGDSDTVQPLDNTHGSIIRLNDDGSVPEDNPFADPNDYQSYRCADTGGVVPEEAPDGAVCAEVFANGLRNPFRITMDPRETEKVKFAVSDVGGSHWEEISWAGTDYAGRNYGYPIHEGPCLHGSSIRCQMPGSKNILEPFHWYAHRKTKEGGCVTGSAFVPEGIGWPSKYKLMFADFIFFEVYGLVEDPTEYCRNNCRPPTSGYTNETFYTVPPPALGDNDRGSITDIFFGPYKETQALYVLTRGGHESVVRIRYTGDVDNSPPVPVIELADGNYNFIVGEELQFDGSKSSDPNDDDLTFSWNFGDGATSSAKKPTHGFAQPGKYDVKLVVTDAAGISQQTSMIVNIGEPPTVTILAPTEDDEFYVGQLFRLKGLAFDYKGERLEDSMLTWEVVKHHADHFHPFMDPTNGNDLELFPAPEPEDFFASTNSYLRIILTATDDDGLTTQTERIVHPWKINVNIESDPPGIEVTVDEHPLTTSREIVSWQGHNLNVFARDQPPYIFQKWWDGNTEQERKIALEEDGQVVKAIYCAQDFWICMKDEDCCSGHCKMMACTSEIAEADMEKISNESEEDDDTVVIEVNDDPVGNEIDDDPLANEGGDLSDSEVDEDSIEKEAETVATEPPKPVGNDEISANSSLSEDKAGLDTVWIALIAIGCGILAIIAIILGRAMTKRKEKIMTTADAVDDNHENDADDDDDRDAIFVDEESGPKDNTNFHPSNADKNETHPSSSTSESVQDALGLNETFETASSTSS